MLKTIKYMSDLHLEFAPMYADPDTADFLILAGDIQVPAKAKFDYLAMKFAWVNEQAKRFPHVLYVLGNHEFYRGDLDKTPRKIQEVLADNVQLLYDDTVTLDGVTFHGATLWTDFENENPMSMMHVQNMMNDYRVIRYNNYLDRFTPQKALQLHKESVQYIDRVTNEGDVIITHMAPHWNSVHAKYVREVTNGGYASNLEPLILDRKPALWFHGHTHSSFDYMVGDTRILCNPRGYSHIDSPMIQENKDFNLNAEVTYETVG